MKGLTQDRAREQTGTRGQCGDISEPGQEEKQPDFQRLKSRARAKEEKSAGSRAPSSPTARWKQCDNGLKS